MLILCSGASFKFKNEEWFRAKQYLALAFLGVKAKKFGFASFVHLIKGGVIHHHPWMRFFKVLQKKNTGVEVCMIKIMKLKNAAVTQEIPICSKSFTTSNKCWLILSIFK